MRASRRCGELFDVCELGIGNVSAALELADRLRSAVPYREVLLVGSAGLYGDAALSETPATVTPTAATTTATTTTVDQAERSASRAGSVLRVGALAAADRFFGCDIASASGMAKLPERMVWSVRSEPGEFFGRLVKRLGLQLCSVNCPDSVTAILPDSFVPPAQLENMESFGAARAAARANIAFGALLAITNMVGPSGSTQWLENHKYLGAHLQESILANL